MNFGVSGLRCTVWALALPMHKTSNQVNRAMSLTPNPQPQELRLGRSDKPVTNAPHGLQMARMRGIVLNIAAQAHDEVVDGAGVGVLVQAPNVGQQGLA